MLREDNLLKQISIVQNMIVANKSIVRGEMKKCLRLPANSLPLK